MAYVNMYIVGVFVDNRKVGKNIIYCILLVFYGSTVYAKVFNCIINPVDNVSLMKNKSLYLARPDTSR